SLLNLIGTNPSIRDSRGNCMRANAGYREPSPLVPAKAGTQGHKVLTRRLELLGPRLRGDERVSKKAGRTEHAHTWPPHRRLSRPPAPAAARERSARAEHQGHLSPGQRHLPD